MATDQPATGLPPTILVIFGITGDLAYKKLLPALYYLHEQQKLPEQFQIIGFARRAWTHDQLYQTIDQSLADSTIALTDSQQLAAFKQRFTYMQSDFANAEGYQQLKEHFKQIQENLGTCVTKLFYFATPPSAFAPIITQLHNAELTHGCAEHGSSEARVVLEKPFGHDLNSAKELDTLFLNTFSEEQMYRIDHYLGKETVQNILAFRFANSIFEPIWNKQYIDHIQITAAEEIGIENRGAFYEETGALRDFLQNHLLQLATAVAMEEPEDLTATAIRSKREQVLTALRPIEDITQMTVRGQYQGYPQEANVDPNSQTETFVALKAYLDTARMQDVPFYLRTGKKLNQKITDITVQFKQNTDSIFHTEATSQFPNTITMRIQPDEGISIRLFTKQPGHGNMVVPTQMDFCYRHAFGGPGQDAYTRLLFDAIAGDQSLFTSTNEIEAAWQFTTPILETWKSTGQPSLQEYSAGSWGPNEANALIEKDGRKWLAEHLIVCPIYDQHPKY